LLAYAALRHRRRVYGLEADQQLPNRTPGTAKLAGSGARAFLEPARPALDDLVDETKFHRLEW
jgi:hypothetical protein